MRSLVPFVACAAVFLGAATTAPEPPDSSGLPKDAQTLRRVLDRGCLAYMLGEKSEAAAMQGLGLTHHGPGLSLTPPGPPYWSGFLPGLSNVVVGRDSCSVNIHGSNVAAYRLATQTVLRLRFGPTAEHGDQSGYTPVLPGQVTGCRDGLRYTYYENPKWPYFAVDLSRVADCGKDPQRSAPPAPPNT